MRAHDEPAIAAACSPQLPASASALKSPSAALLEKACALVLTQLPSGVGPLGGKHATQDPLWRSLAPKTFHPSDPESLGEGPRSRWKGAYWIGRSSCLERDRRWCTRMLRLRASSRWSASRNSKALIQQAIVAKAPLCFGGQTKDGRRHGCSVFGPCRNPLPI